MHPKAPCILTPWGTAVPRTNPRPPAPRSCAGDAAGTAVTGQQGFQPYVVSRPFSPGLCPVSEHEKHGPLRRRPQPAQLQGSRYSLTELQQPCGCLVLPWRPECPPAVSGMREGQSWCPSILQAEHSSSFGADLPADRDPPSLQARTSGRGQTLRQQHLQPSHFHFPEPF